MHFVSYLYIANTDFTNYNIVTFFLYQISIMMVSLYSKNLISRILEFDKMYDFINKVFISV
jgi:hypothetical protein